MMDIQWSVVALCFQNNEAPLMTVFWSMVSSVDNNWKCPVLVNYSSFLIFEHTHHLYLSNEGASVPIHVQYLWYFGIDLILVLQHLEITSLDFLELLLPVHMKLSPVRLNLVMVFETQSTLDEFFQQPQLHMSTEHTNVVLASHPSYTELYPTLSFSNETACSNWNWWCWIYSGGNRCHVIKRILLHNWTDSSRRLEVTFWSNTCKDVPNTRFEPSKSNFTSCEAIVWTGARDAILSQRINFRHTNLVHNETVEISETLPHCSSFNLTRCSGSENSFVRAGKETSVRDCNVARGSMSAEASNVLEDPLRESLVSWERLERRRRPLRVNLDIDDSDKERREEQFSVSTLSAKWC